jgi:hypothetical protein
MEDLPHPPPDDLPKGKSERETVHDAHHRLAGRRNHAAECQGYRGRFVGRAVRPATSPEALGPPAARKPLSARIREIWTDIPDEIRTKLPADGASQHDHYIHGVPKRAE